MCGKQQQIGIAVVDLPILRPFGCLAGKGACLTHLCLRIENNAQALLVAAGGKPRKAVEEPVIHTHLARG